MCAQPLYYLHAKDFLGLVHERFLGKVSTKWWCGQICSLMLTWSSLALPLMVSPIFWVVDFSLWAHMSEWHYLVVHSTYLWLHGRGHGIGRTFHFVSHLFHQWLLRVRLHTASKRATLQRHCMDVIPSWKHRPYQPRIDDLYQTLWMIEKLFKVYEDCSSTRKRCNGSILRS